MLERRTHQIQPESEKLSVSSLIAVNPVHFPVQERLENGSDVLAIRHASFSHRRDISYKILHLRLKMTD